MENKQMINGNFNSTNLESWVLSVILCVQLAQSPDRAHT